MKGELLAPAGSFDALKAAVRSGADAVYFGLDTFSARSAAENIQDDELTEAIKFCHLRDSKAYAAVNTLILDKEFRSFSKAVEKLTLAGADGVIIQDLGAAKIVKAVSPEMPVHASTQMSVHSLEGVKLLERHGFSRVVLARELSREDVKYICRNTDTEIEVFVHGALCVSYSGKCLFSSMIGKRSGNRGKCAQPCRLPYTKDGETSYFLSPYDLCLLDEVVKMAEYPVASFKIEGRMKSPSYVAIVTSVYRKALDGKDLTYDDTESLKEIFCRGERFTKGFFGSDNNFINKTLSNEKTGRTASAKLISKAKSLCEKEGKRGKINLKLTQIGTKAVLTAEKNGITASESMEMSSLPLDHIRIHEQLAKLGNTPFQAENESIEIEGNIFLKISELNELRRNVCVKLESIFEPHRRTVRSYDEASELFRCSDKTNIKTKLSAYINDKSQFKAANELEKVYIPLYLADHLNSFGCSETALVLPAIVHRSEQDTVIKKLEKALDHGIIELVCQSIDNIELVKDYNICKTAGFELNITNGLSLDFYQEAGMRGFTLSTELSFDQMKEIAMHTEYPVNAIIYGRVPLMLTQTCIINDCKNKNCSSALTDRTNAQFPVRKEGNSCRNIIFNSRPLYLADKNYDGNFLDEGILYFTTENANECLDIIKRYKNKEPYDGLFTRGYQLGGKY